MAYARSIRPETLDFMMTNIEPLSQERALLAMSAAMTADGHFEETQNFLSYVLQVHKDPEAVREIILQTHLFCGYPRALNALEALKRAMEKQGLDGLRQEISEKEQVEAYFLERGEELWQKVYGKNADRVASNAQNLSPDLAYWSKLEGYGRVLSRPGPDALTREFCVVSALVLMETPLQLKGHVQGVVNLGGQKEELWQLLSLLRKFFETDRLFDQAQKTFEAVIGKKPHDVSFEEEQAYRWG